LNIVGDKQMQNLSLQEVNLISGGKTDSGEPGIHEFTQDISTASAIAYVSHFITTSAYSITTSVGIPSGIATGIAAAPVAAGTYLLFSKHPEFLSDVSERFSFYFA
jgi:hypothetical protein